MNLTYILTSVYLFNFPRGGGGKLPLHLFYFFTCIGIPIEPIVYFVCDSASEFGAMGFTSFSGFSYPNCKALSLSARASPLRVSGFLRRSALHRWSRSVSRPYKDSYDSSPRPMGAASQYSTLPCSVATFPVSLPLSSPGDVWPRLSLLPSTRP